MRVLLSILLLAVLLSGRVGGCNHNSPPPLQSGGCVLTHQNGEPVYRCGP